MQNERIILAGFGGQGIMTMGQLLAQAGLSEDRHVSWLPSYGPEMRGGTAYCNVIIDDQEIASPIISGDASSVLIMNLPSMKFVDALVPGGQALINSSLIEQPVERTDVEAFYVPANDIANEIGNMKATNMVMLGAYCTMTQCVQPESILAAMEKKLGAKAARFMDMNRAAFAKGAEAIEQQAHGEHHLTPDEIPVARVAQPAFQAGLRG